MEVGWVLDFRHAVKIRGRLPVSVVRYRSRKLADRIPENPARHGSDAECRIFFFCTPHSSDFPGFAVNDTECAVNITGLTVNVTECIGFCAGFFRENRALWSA